MDQLKYQRQAEGAQFRPNKVTDSNVRAIARQGERVIRGMERQRDSELRDRDRVLRQMQNNAAIESRNRETQFNLDTKAARVGRSVIEMDAQTAQNNIKREQERDRKIFGALSELSKTATEQYIKGEQQKFDDEYLDELNNTLINGLDLQTLSEYKLATDNLNIAGEQIEVTADIMAAEGQADDIVEQARRLNPARTQGRNRALAQMAGNQFKGWAQQELINNKDFKVVIPGPDGTTREISPSEATTASEKAAVLQAMVPIYLQMNGLYGASPEFLAPALASMRESMNEIVSGQRKTDAKNLQDMRIDSVRVQLAENTNIANFQLYVSELSRSRGPNGQPLTRKAALQKGWEYIIESIGPDGNPLFTDDQVEEIGRMTLEDQPNKPISERFPGWNDSLNTRRNKDQAAYNQREREQAREFDEQTDALIQDLQDGTVDYNNTNIDAAIEAFTQQGNTDGVARLKAMRAGTPDSLAQKATKEIYDERLLRGLLTPDEVMLSPLDGTTKQNYLDRIREVGGPISTTQSEAASNLVTTRLAQMIGTTLSPDGKSSEPSFARAAAYAEAQWRRDYIAARQDGKSETDAQKYADSQFDKEVKLGLNGRYATKNYKLNNNDFTGFKNFEVDTNTDFNVEPARIRELIQANPQAVQTEVLISADELKAIDNKIKSGQRFNVPTLATYISQDLQYKANGKPINALQVLDMQLKAAGYEGVPKEVLNTGNQLVEEIDPDLQPYITWRPSAIRTRVALNGSERATFQSISYSNAQRQSLDILAKYESGAWGYDAYNQGGADDGRRVVGKSGAYSQSGLGDGRALTQMTVAEVMQAQSGYNDGSITDAQWRAQGGIWTAGRYQFIGPTLKGLVERYGIPPNVLFDEKLQDYLALRYMQESGISPWVGPSDNATPTERQIIATAQQQDLGTPVWRRPENMRPSLQA